MNETGISAYSPLDSARIDKKDYTNSLVAEACRVGRMSESDVDRIRGDLMNALAEIIGYYTENQSTSVKAETARQLSLSMMFNIDTYLRSLGSHEEALKTLLDRRMSELYGKGYLMNTETFREAKQLYGKVRLSRLRNGGPEYDKALDQYLHYYLSNYSPKFHAHMKVYLSLPKFGIRGNFNIRQTVTVLKKLFEINQGPRSKADVVMNPETESGTDGGAESESNS